MKTAAELQAAVNLVKANIARAQKAPDAADNVLLLAVSKTRSAEEIAPLTDLGCRDLGENRVQEVIEKYPLLPDVRWHLIGALQTNKVKYIIDKVCLIHSLDREDLAAEINKRAEASGIVMPCLLQLNLEGETSKSGLKGEDIRPFLAALDKYPHIKLQGLMTIGTPHDDCEAARPLFRQVRLLAAHLAQEYPHLDFSTLSMGMSNDYVVAVEEGATIVRVGTTIFGPRPTPQM